MRNERIQVVIHKNTDLTDHSQLRDTSCLSSYFTQIVSKIWLENVNSMYATCILNEP